MDAGPEARVGDSEVAPAAADAGKRDGGDAVEALVGPGAVEIALGGATVREDDVAYLRKQRAHGGVGHAAGGDVGDELCTLCVEAMELLLDDVSG